MQIVPNRRLVQLGLAVVVSVAAIAIGDAPVEASDVVTRWEHFSESRGCAAPYTRPPFASKKGGLSNSEPIFGPFGTYFGRTVAQARSHQVWWTVPHSGGVRVRVHKGALPAFQQVTRNLAAHAAQGRVYSIRSVGAFNPRTVGGSYQISRHTFGIAIDINPAQNPHRLDGKLITDMPEWFVDAWRDAGFCWGGDWTSSKDTMHFSWIGPGTGYGDELSPLDPATSKKDFNGPGIPFETAIAPVIDRYSLIVGNATGNGGPDVAGLRSHADGAVLDVASGYGEFGSCSLLRWFIEEGAFASGEHTLLMDIAGDSREDIVVLNETGGLTNVMVAYQFGDYEDHESFTIPVSNIRAVAGSDFDGDHVADLWVATGDGQLEIYSGPRFQIQLSSSSLPSGAPDQISAADRDGQDQPDLFALYGASIDVLEIDGTWELVQSFQTGVSSEISAIGATEFDGDGRADLLVLDEVGILWAFLGNTSTGVPQTRWFVNPDRDCSDPVILEFDGRFFDDEQSVHVNGIEFIASRGITVGCNPPFNDRFCPRDNLTRAQAATFIVRAIGLPPSNEDHFVDDNGHVLESAINSLADAGITMGCNPPTNNRFCPNRQMTRAEFGTFLVRALRIPASKKDFFVDDDGHILENAINALAAAGITRGCNPPTDDMFCPDRPLSRAEAATFLTRALP